MPGSVIAATACPNKILQFTEADHRYVIRDKQTNQEIQELISATTLIEQYFPPFDANGISHNSACRQLGVDSALPPTPVVEAKAAEIRSVWKAAADYGTHVHEYMEDLMLGRPPRRTPENEKESTVFGLGASFARKLKPKLENITPERIICDPEYGVAGCIDLLAKDPHADQLIIIDWKTNKEITTESFMHKFGFPPIEHLPDCKFSHYSLQLNLYEFILKHAGYILPRIPILKYLVHIHPTKGVNVMAVPDRQREITDILNDHRAKKA